jgi:hypothetical protein
MSRNKHGQLIAIVALMASLILTGASSATAGENNRSLTEALLEGTTSGQIRLGYLWLNPEASGQKTTSDLALGGQLKFETAPLYGVSLGAAFYSAHSLTEADEDDFNDELSSASQHYDLLAEAYIDYGAGDFDLRVGRQLIDTPFADSDDIRMTPHTFEALFFSYQINNLLFQGGYLTAWQGVDAGYPDDADFDDLVQDSDGTLLLGALYTCGTIEGSLWYYNVDDVVNILYADMTSPIRLNDTISLNLGVQISIQNDSTSNATYAQLGAEIAGTLYGAMAEITIGAVTVGAAFDHADIDSGEALFGGFGGGPFFTNIDTLVANEFAAGQDADSCTLSIRYDFAALGVEGLSAGYTYGNYRGGEDVMDKNADAEADEHDLWVEYALDDNWSLDAIYVVSTDQEHSSDWDYERAQLRINFTF